MSDISFSLLHPTSQFSWLLNCHIDYLLMSMSFIRHIFGCLYMLQFWRKDVVCSSAPLMTLVIGNWLAMSGLLWLRLIIMNSTFKDIFALYPEKNKQIFWQKNCSIFHEPRDKKSYWWTLSAPLEICWKSHNWNGSNKICAKKLNNILQFL